MKLTREQEQEIERVLKAAGPKLNYVLATGIRKLLNAACEVEEVDPVGEEAEKFKASTGTFGPWTTEEAAAFHRHMLAKHRPAFDEGRARVITMSLMHRIDPSEVSERNHREMYRIIQDAIKEYTCGSSGSDGGRGAGSSGSSTAPSAEASTQGSDAAISSSVPAAGGVCKCGCSLDAHGAGSSGTSGKHQEDQSSKQTFTSTGARSPVPAFDVDAKSTQNGGHTGHTQEPSTTSETSKFRDAPAADAWCRWETVDQFCGRMTKEHPSGGSIGQLVVARDTGWTKRFTEGDLSVRAWQDATRPMGELAPSYGVWLKDRLTQ